MSALRVVRASGIVAPSRRVPTASGGRSMLTNFSPSRLVCRSAAVAFSGRTTSLFRLTTMCATNPLSSMVVTEPIVTSLTLTADWGTRSKTSLNSMLTSYPPPPTPPGSGKLAAPLKVQPDSAEAPTTATADQVIARVRRPVMAGPPGCRRG